MKRYRSNDKKEQQYTFKKLSVTLSQVFRVTNVEF